MAKPQIPITGNDEADQLLVDDPLALLLGMLLDQQVPMEWAFTGPHTLKQRLGHLDPAKIAAMPVEEFVDVCREKPAIHRFPKSMGERAHAVCEHVVERYDGHAERIWTDAPDAKAVYDRLRDVPGYGDEKTKIFVAILAKRFGIRPEGWEQVAGPFADDTPRSVADVSSEETLLEVRRWKKAQKAAKKSKQQ
ncbi:MAG TPA: HhH-GPD-type base excision DNA repair protein [Acidimicrobiales bacterium]|nr:HhH-GPD-type base excision DNA repair protein [Acidimicrobiales bacterium]